MRQELSRWGLGNKDDWGILSYRLQYSDPEKR